MHAWCGGLEVTHSVHCAWWLSVLACFCPQTGLTIYSVSHKNMQSFHHNLSQTLIDFENYFTVRFLRKYCIYLL